MCNLGFSVVFLTGQWDVGDGAAHGENSRPNLRDRLPSHFSS